MSSALRKPWPFLAAGDPARIDAGQATAAWVGRGTYDKSGWSEALKEARGAHNKQTAEYLLRLPLLGDYLEESLAALEEEAVDVRHRKQTKTKGAARL